jgi:triosephosphate isomerase
MKLIAGNWKMNGLRESLDEIDRLALGLSGRPALPEVLVCPPATLLSQLAGRVKGTNIMVGGQYCHPNQNGAFTGDVSAEMLKDAGATYVIVGHSERRFGHHETNEQVSQQAVAAQRAGLTPIICIGESEDIRASGRTQEFLARQVSESVPTRTGRQDITIAYEPIWAIGTGRTAAIQDVTDTHSFIKSHLRTLSNQETINPKILYGGSVKGANAAQIMAANNVDGVLVGGASLKASEFLAIILATTLQN